MQLQYFKLRRMYRRRYFSTKVNGTNKVSHGLPEMLFLKIFWRLCAFVVKSEIVHPKSEIT